VLAYLHLREGQIQRDSVAAMYRRKGLMSHGTPSRMNCEGVYYTGTANDKTIRIHYLTIPFLQTNLKQRKTNSTPKKLLNASLQEFQ